MVQDFAQCLLLLESKFDLGYLDQDVVGCEWIRNGKALMQIIKEELMNKITNSLSDPLLLFK